MYSVLQTLVTSILRRIANIYKTYVMCFSKSRLATYQVWLQFIVDNYILDDKLDYTYIFRITAAMDSLNFTCPIGVSFLHGTKIYRAVKLSVMYCSITSIMANGPVS